MSLYELDLLLGERILNIGGLNRAGSRFSDGTGLEFLRSHRQDVVEGNPESPFGYSAAVGR